MSNLRFSFLLKIALNERGVKQIQLEEMLKERGIDNITRKRISEYIRGISTPSLEKAKAIFEALEFPMEESDIAESLNLNKLLIKEEKEQLDASESYKKTINLAIRLKNLNSEKSSIDNERRLIERVQEIYGSKDILTYVEQLIALDLKNPIL